MPDPVVLLVGASALTQLPSSGEPWARVKGAVAKFQWVQEAFKASGDSSQSERLRRLRRQIARVHEVRRLSFAGREVPQGLLQRV